MKINSKQVLISALLAGFLIGCGNSNSHEISNNNEHQGKKNNNTNQDNQQNEKYNVIVERGPVINATVTDSKGQVGINDGKSHVYVFNQKISYPVSVTSNENTFIDVNDDKMLNSGDVRLGEIKLLSCEENVTSISTYILNQTQGKCEKIDETYQKLSLDLNIPQEQLKKLPSEQNQDALVLSNVVFANLYKKQNVNNDELKNQFQNEKDSSSEILKDKNASFVEEYFIKKNEIPYIGQNSQPNHDNTNNNQMYKAVIIAPKTLINADFSDIGTKQILIEQNASFNYNDSIQAQNDSGWTDALDNKITSIDYKNDKLVSSSVYHNALVVFDKDANNQFTPFAALKEAGHGEYATLPDGVTQASENWFEKVKFDKTGEYLYALVKPKKYTSETAQSSTYGIYKLKLNNLNINIKDESTKFINGKFYDFDIFNNGNIMTHDDQTGRFVIYDGNNFNKINEFTIPNSYRFDLKNDRFVVYQDIEDTNETFIQEYDPLTAQPVQGKKVEYDRYLSGSTLFELTHDGKRLFTHYDRKGTKEICSFALDSLDKIDKKCFDFSSAGRLGSAFMSEDSKYLIFTGNSSGREASIFNIENDPFLAQVVPTGKYSYDAYLSKDNNLFITENKNEIKKYKISYSSNTISYDDKINKVANSIFTKVSQDINNIVVYEKTRHGKTYIKGDIDFPTHVNGINATWGLSEELKEYIDENATLLKVPTSKVTGKVSVKLQMLKNDEVLREVVKQSEISLVPDNK